MKLYLNKKLLSLAESLLSDLGIDVKRMRFTVKQREVDEVLDECREIASDQSLLSNKHEIVTTIVDRLTTLTKINEAIYNAFYPENEELKLKSMEVEASSGYMTYLLFGRSLFDVDYAKHGFNSFYQFISVIGAYLFNALNVDSYEAQYYWETRHNDGRVMLNRYYRNINGDFRFIQYDVSPRISLNAFGEETEIFVPDHKMLYAYHSLEPMFLATVLRYAIQAKAIPEQLSNYESFMQELNLDEARLGFFGDAGMKQDFCFEVGLLDSEIPNINDKQARNWHALPKEYEGHQSPFIDSGNLVYPSSGLIFTSNDISPLFIATHKACQEGFGRVSLGNIATFVRHIIEDRGCNLAGAGDKISTI